MTNDIGKWILMAGVFILMDILTGLVKALTKGDFNSQKMRVGLMHKAGELLAVALGFAIDWSLPIMGVQMSISWLSFVSIYIVLMEVASIIENIGIMCPPVGKALSKVFAELKSVNGLEQIELTDAMNDAKDEGARVSAPGRN